MIGPHGLRPLDVSTDTDMHAGRDLHDAIEDSPRADSRARIDQGATTELSTRTDDGPIADHAPRVETRAFGDQHVGTHQAHLGDDSAGAYTSAREQLRGVGNACRRIDGNAHMGVRSGAIIADERGQPRMLRRSNTQARSTGSRRTRFHGAAS